MHINQQALLKLYLSKIIDEKYVIKHSFNHLNHLCIKVFDPFRMGHCLWNYSSTKTQTGKCIHLNNMIFIRIIFWKLYTNICARLFKPFFLLRLGTFLVFNNFLIYVTKKLFLNSNELLHFFRSEFQKTWNDFTGELKFFFVSLLVSPYSSRPHEAQSCILHCCRNEAFLWTFFFWLIFSFNQSVSIFFSSWPKTKHHRSLNVINKMVIWVSDTSIAVAVFTLIKCRLLK